MATTKPVWNLANAVTMARVLMVPVVLVVLVVGESDLSRWVAAGLFTLAAATDKLDGYLARRLGQVTDWGKLLDPIADKALIGGSLITLSALGEIPWWITVVVLARELGITVMRLAVLKYVVIAASPGGKLKTVLQSVGIGIFLLPLDSLPGVVTVLAWIVLIAAVVVTVVTGIDYLRRGLALRGSTA
ncbi:CDP-diacylglycerol--glycerol-3-phosphate 3-phosphatidyltransferase [Actinotalea sp.]|uniref:CDP-diacylglycerol--glycerol-3-phosphate 3-phosphatidyltransferase n=1 Tax=Actinotalea sp. TaxID=1872145 RepID=UPI00356599AD